MKYLRSFETEADYSAYTQSEEYVTPNVCLIEDEQVVKMSKFEPLPEPVALSFKSSSSFSITPGSSDYHWNGTLECSTDKRTWQTCTGGNTYTAKSEQGIFQIYFRGTNNTTITNNNEGGRWQISGSSVSCAGDIRTLLNYVSPQSATMGDYCFKYLFQNCTSLITPPELPSTSLSDSCYFYMFSGCTSLATAPVLPATTLQNACYWGMFQGCASLATAPELPATSITHHCYNGMFKNCTSLIIAPELHAQFMGIQCYMEMFQGCTSLTTAPYITSSSRTTNCYARMFQGCESLNSICYYGDKWFTNYASDWVDGVAATGTFTKLSSVDISYSKDGIPPGWTIVNV